MSLFMILYLYLGQGTRRGIAGSSDEVISYGTRYFTWIILSPVEFSLHWEIISGKSFLKVAVENNPTPF